jgi:integrase
VYVLELPPDPATGKRRREKFKSLVQGKAKDKFEARRKALIANGTLKSSEAPSLGNWLDRWLDEFKGPNLKPRTLETYRSDVENIRRSIGAVHLDKLEPGHVRKMERDIVAHRSSKTALNAYRRLSSALDDAVRESLIDSNVCHAVDPIRVEANPTKILPEGAPAKLLLGAGATPVEPRRKRGQRKDPDTPDDRAMWRLMWRVAFETGMRQGERFAIRPCDVVMAGEVPSIHVRHELQRYRSDAEIPSWLKAVQIEGGNWLVPPKSHKGVRMVPISRDLWDTLRQWAATHSIADDGLLFVRRGHPLTNPVERRRWYKALEQAGLPRVTIRSARHYFATRLAMAGASEDARKAIMGHVDIGTTAGYTHWSPEALEKITGAVNTRIIDTREGDE